MSSSLEAAKDPHFQFTDESHPNTTSLQVPKRIVFSTMGSHGDLHPYVAIGIGLKKRGHRVTIATGDHHRDHIEATGLEFCSMRPDYWSPNQQSCARYFTPKLGTVRLLREVIIPSLRDSFDDVVAVASNADVLISHPLTFATRIAAEKLNIPWVSTAFSPFCFLSGYDPCVLAIAPRISRMTRALGPSFYRPLSSVLKSLTQSWAAPINELSRELQLPIFTDGNPMIDCHSPWLCLAMFPELIATAQRDWPSRVCFTGFPHYDRTQSVVIPENLAEFLESGERPVVFTQGSTTGKDARRFFEVSARAAKLVGTRAILAAGSNASSLTHLSSDKCFVAGYVPFSKLFPMASVVVHQAGIGTLGLTLRSGRPMLTVPYTHDQPDNAMRAVRLGVAENLDYQSYTAQRVARQLRKLMQSRKYQVNSRRVQRQLNRENGVSTACDAIESLLRQRVRSTEMV